MTFLNPFAWIAAVAAGIPLLIHLLSRRKARRESFPALRFLRQVHRQEVRRIRLREWLLLLIRTLAVVCMALAFARPALQGSRGASSHAPTSVVTVVDRSLSMRANGPRGSRFEEARARLRELGALIEPGSEVQALAFDRHPAPVFEDFTHDPARFRSAADNLRPGYGGTDIGAAIREGARWLRGRPGLHRELFVVSDFQASGMDSAGARGLGEATRGMEIYLVPVGPREAQNAAWVSAEATRVGAGGELSATIRNTSGEPRRGALVEAVAGGRLLGASRVDMPARAETRVNVPVQGLSANDLGATLRFPHDALEEDDQVAVAFPSSRPMRVALVGADDQKLYVAAALRAAPGAYEIQSSEDGSDLQPAEVWVVLDPERVNASSLRAHVARGGGVLAVMGENYARRVVEQALGDASPGSAGAADGDSTGRSFARLRVLEAGAPSFRGLAERRGMELSSSRFARWVRLAPAPGATSLAEFTPDAPALLERGHVLLLATSLDGRWNDFPLSPSFVPWLYQSLDVLASRTRPTSVEAGSRWVRPVPAEWKGLPLALVDPEGRAVQMDLTQGGAELRSAPLDLPGLYTLRVSGRPADAVAAVLPADEADLRGMPLDAISRLVPGAHLVQAGLREEVMRRRYGRELWREFLIAALALLVLETVVSRLTVARSA